MASVIEHKCQLEFPFAVQGFGLLIQPLKIGIKKSILEGTYICPFCEATDTPVFDSWLVTSK